MIRQLRDMGQLILQLLWFMTQLSGRNLCKSLTARNNLGLIFGVVAFEIQHDELIDTFVSHTLSHHSH